MVPPSVQEEMENFAQTQKYCKTAANIASERTLRQRKRKNSPAPAHAIECN
jgi:hypothetical protein